MPHSSLLYPLAWQRPSLTTPIDLASRFADDVRSLGSAVSDLGDLVGLARRALRQLERLEERADRIIELENQAGGTGLERKL